MAADQMPWVVVAPEGVHWLGHADDEEDAWTIALGWPDVQEVAEAKRRGWYAAQATASWKRPDGVPACGSHQCIAGQRDGVLCADGECDRENGVRPDGVEVRKP